MSITGKFSDYSKEQLIKELDDLQMKYEELQHSYKQHMSEKSIIEESLLDRTDLLYALNHFSIDLGDLEGEKLYQYIADKFRELFNVRAVGFCIYNEAEAELEVVASTVSEEDNSVIVKYLGQRVNNFRVKLTEEFYGFMTDEVIKHTNSLSVLSFGQIPEIAGSIIEKRFGIGWFQGVSLVNNGKLFGSLVIAGHKGQQELKDDIVTVFAELTSNILRRKQAEEKLLFSENKFKRAFYTSPDSVNINRLSDGMYVSINKGFTRITGYSEEEVIGKTSIELNIWADPADRAKLVKGLIEKGEVENLEARFLMKSGDILNGIMSAAIIDLNGIPHILSITRDISDRIEAENALRRSETKYRELIELAPDGILLGSPEGIITGANSRMLNLTGRKLNELLGLNINVLFKSDELSKKPFRYDLLLEGKVVMNERNLLRHDGVIIPVEMHSRMMPDGSYQSILHDITERKKFEKTIKKELESKKKAQNEVKRINVALEQRVAERTAQLEMANKELESFAYSVSHDLRAPLRAIDGFSKYLTDDPDHSLNPESVRLLNLIRSNTKKMDQLIIDILALSRVSRNSLKKSRLDMGKMAISMLNEVASPDILNKLTVTTGEMPEAFADSSYLKQVWINLISNAVKFSSGKSEPHIEFGGYIKESFNVYYVRDNGVGFKPEYGHKLFGVFQRLHGTEEFEGNGVGLAIVQRVIHRHDGKVWAEGRPGEGATFYFSLPR